MVIFYKKWKKFNEIQLTKNKMDLNIRKMTNHPPLSLPNLNKIITNIILEYFIRNGKNTIKLN